MLSNFLSYFNANIEMEYSGDLYSDFILQLGGKSFGKGLFNSFSNDNVKKWTEIIHEAYPDFNRPFKLFGYDWLGRCFGIDMSNGTYGIILMFEIGLNEILEIPCKFEEFLNEEIQRNTNACLSDVAFRKWMEVSKEPIEYGRCAGYKIPLCLGGKDEINNLEDSDMEVYWGIMSQLSQL